MKKTLFILTLLIVLTACGGKKSVVKERSRNNVDRAEKQTKANHEIHATEDIVYNIINNARRFEGTRYKFGGTTKRGMDCSGLIYVAFQEESIPLPRVSRDMAKTGKRIKLKDVSAGDLLFFKTNKTSRNINHVGLVVDILPNQILFIHSTSSKGVIISSLNEGYWNNAYVEARRVI